MSKTSSWVIKETQKRGSLMTPSDSSYETYVAERCFAELKRIAEGHDDPRAIARSVLREFGMDVTPVDPETVPNHDYASDREATSHWLATTQATAPQLITHNPLGDAI